MKAISLLIPLLVIWNCWADGVREANVGKISIAITSVSYDSEKIKIFSGLEYEYFEKSSNIVNINLNLQSSDLIPYLNRGKFSLNADCRIECPRKGIGGCSIFSRGFGFVSIPFRDGIQVSDPEFSSQKSMDEPAEYAFLNYAFHMLFTDPTLMTAETHEYKIEFWDCLNGQCELNEYDKKTVKRGEAIITVNYTP